MKKSFKGQVWFTGIFWLVFIIISYSLIDNRPKLNFFISLGLLVLFGLSLILENMGIFFNPRRYKWTNIMAGLMIGIIIVFGLVGTFNKDLTSGIFASGFTYWILISILGVLYFLGTLMAYRDMEKKIESKEF